MGQKQDYGPIKTQLTAAPMLDGTWGYGNAVDSCNLQHHATEGSQGCSVEAGFGQHVAQVHSKQLQVGLIHTAEHTPPPQACVLFVQRLQMAGLICVASLTISSKALLTLCVSCGFALQQRAGFVADLWG